MLRTGAVVAAGLERTEDTFPLFLQTWHALIDGAAASYDGKECRPDQM